MKGTLQIVATPIGNTQDISFRAAKTLLTAPIIACEDTRKTGLLLIEVAKLFSGYKERNKPQLISFYDDVEEQKIPMILEILQSGNTVALVSDAGTPTISDPGFKLVRECIAKGINVQTIPGPSAVIAALSTSGLPTDRFFFVGYPPKKEGHRMSFWKDMQKFKQELHTTIIFYESPHRVVQTIDEMIEILGKDTNVVIARELTKVYEEILRGSLDKLKKFFQNTEPKGEFVILL